MHSIVVEEPVCSRLRATVATNATPLEIMSQEQRGSLQEGYTNTSEGSCGGGGPEVFYRLDLDQPNRLIATARGFDTVLYLRSACDQNSELACVDDSRPPGRYGSQIDTRLDPGTYYLALDSYNPQETGDFSLGLELCPRVCEQGETRCAGASGIERCEMNREGCIAWGEAESCSGEAACQEGVCVAAAEGDSCETAESLDVSENTSVNITGVIDQSYTLRVGSRCSTEETRDRFYTFDVDQESRLELISIGEGVSALSLYQDCPSGPNSGLELSCVPGVDNELRLDSVLASGRYTVVVSSDDIADYELSLSLSANCIDECDMSLPPYCDEREGVSGDPEEFVVACLVGMSGCTELTVADECSGRVCAGGACQEECFDSCELGERECVDRDTVIACVADERGCLFWEPTESCGDDEVCVGQGQCEEIDSDWGMGGGGMEAIDEGGLEAGDEEDNRPIREGWEGYPGPKEVFLPKRTRGGCQQSPGESPFPTFLILFAMSFITVSNSKRNQRRES